MMELLRNITIASAAIIKVTSAIIGIVACSLPAHILRDGNDVMVQIFRGVNVHNMTVSRVVRGAEN
jgi:hypothetical protein